MVIHNNLHCQLITTSTYTMFALYQCGFSSAREDNIPVPVNPKINDLMSTCFAGDCVNSNGMT